ncbi:hypothetical protein K523DRAFT_97060, partial [Schizophyllum commune Tattone D]
EDGHNHPLLSRFSESPRTRTRPGPPQHELRKVFRSALWCTPPARARARRWIEDTDLPSMSHESSGAGLPESSNFSTLRYESCQIAHGLVDMPG